MSTSTLTSPGGSPLGTTSTADDDVRLTFPRIVRSEWIKFRTLRSTMWTLGITVILMVGVSVLFAFGIRSAGDDAQGVTGSVIVIGGYYFGQLTLAVLGVLVISGEYSTGMIRSTLAAVPTRLPALWAKAIVLTIAALIVSLASVAISALVTRPIISGTAFVLDLGDGDSMRIILGSALYLAAMALLAFGLGALLRHSAAALAAVFGLLLVVPIVFAIIPGTFFQKVSPFLPSNAGGQLMTPQAQIDAMAAADSAGAVLGPWEGFGVLLVWVVVIMTAAAVLLRRRNA